MEILQIFNRYTERGGEEIAVEKISKILSQYHSLTNLFFDSIQADEISNPMAAVRVAAQMIWNPKSARKLREMYDLKKPDFLLLHNYFPVGSPSILVQSYKKHLPVIAYIHNFRPFSVNGYLWCNDRLETSGLKKNFISEIRHASWQNSSLKTAFYASILLCMHAFRLFEKISAWIAISDFMRAKFIQAGIPERKIFTLRHPWEKMPVLSERGNEGNYFLFLGRLTSAKGISVLFETWHLLQNRLLDDTPELIIAGSGPMAQEVRDRCAADRFIRYVGHVDSEEKEKLITNCKAMLAPSLWWEPLGLVTYEAYNYGKPMLAAKSGGLTETIVPGVTGYLHEPGNASELAAQILELESSPELRRVMGENGRQWLIKHASVENWVDRFNDIVGEVLNQRDNERISE